MYMGNKQTKSYTGGDTYEISIKEQTYVQKSAQCSSCASIVGDKF